MCIRDRFNKDTRELFCARDRLGIKPFYYIYTSDSFTFASNTKALLDKNDDLSIDSESLHYQFTLHSVVPAPNTIISVIQKLEPGFFAKIDA